MSKNVRVITGRVRFSYVNVWAPKSINGSDEKYSVSIIIPKSDKQTLLKIQEAIEQAKIQGRDKFGWEESVELKLPLRDGDLERSDDEAYSDSWFVNANSIYRPGIVDGNLAPIMNPGQFYSGCFGRASLTFYPYSQAGSTGIACGLDNIQKLADGPTLTRSHKAADDFAVDDVDLDILS